MDIEEIRLMIRQSLERHLGRQAEIEKTIPESFSEFQRRLISSFIDVEIPDSVIAQLENCSLYDPDLFEILQRGWESILIEHDDGNVESWFDCVKYYLSEPLSEVLIANGVPYHKSALMLDQAFKSLIKS